MITPLPLDPNLVRALGPGACTPEVTGRLRRLADDLDRIAAGTAPTQMDLKTAPLLVDWQLTTRLTGICLTGFVAGHPLLGNTADRDLACVGARSRLSLGSHPLALLSAGPSRRRRRHRPCRPAAWRCVTEGNSDAPR